MWVLCYRTFGTLTLALGAFSGAWAAPNPSCAGPDTCAAAAPSLLSVKVETNAAPFDVTEGHNATNGTNASLEDAILRNLQHDMEEAAAMPDLENLENSSNASEHGLGRLGANLEFLMLKVAQLETVAELQQIEIRTLREEMKDMKDMKESGATPGSTPSLTQLKAEEAAKTQNAGEMLKKVLHKHNHQREQGEFGTIASPSPAGKAGDAQHAAQLQRRAKRSQQNATFLGDVIDSIGGAITSGTGLIGDALGDAYASAADQVSFVANTVVDTVGMAMDILKRGFTDFAAGCDDSSWPSMSIKGRGLDIDFGRQKCWIRLMGQKKAQTERGLHETGPGQRLAPTTG